MKSHILLVVFVVKMVAYAMLLALLLVMLVGKLGAAEIDVEQLNNHLEQIGDPPIYTTVPYPFTGPNSVTYVLNPDGTVSVGPNQCLQPDGNVTIAKPVLDHAESTMINPEWVKITYPAKLVRIHKVPFDGKRLVLQWEDGWDLGKYHEPSKLHKQTHHFLQVDDAGKEVNAFWDGSLPEDPEPEPKPKHNQHVDDKGFFRWDDNNRVVGHGDGHDMFGHLDPMLAVPDDSKPITGQYAALSVANGGTGVTTSAMSGGIVVQQPVPWNWYAFILPFISGAFCYWLGSLAGRRK